MPYIPDKKKRTELSMIVILVINALSRDNNVWGELNYFFTKVLHAVMNIIFKKSYFTIMCIMGTLVCVAFEFYRRIASPYEDIKIKENGDVV